MQPISINGIVSDFGFTFDSQYHFDLIEAPQRKSPFVSPESGTQNIDFIDNRTDFYFPKKILKLPRRLTVGVQKRDYLKNRRRFVPLSAIRVSVNLGWTSIYCN